MKYFAYGTNLNLEQMLNRCPHMYVVGTARLPDHQLFFTERGVPSIKYKAESEVWGVVYDLDEDCIASLDRYEGFPKLYTKKSLEVNLKGRLISTFVYIANSNNESMPKQSYWETLISGAMESELPQTYILEIQNRYGFK